MNNDNHYAGPVRVGELFQWEPWNEGSAVVVEVTRFDTAAGLVYTKLVRGNGPPEEVYNPESVFRNACVPIKTQDPIATTTEKKTMPESHTVAGTPADPTVRYTELTLGKETYQLAYDFEAVAKAEFLTGMELLVGVNWRRINARRIRAMLYASMLKARPEITIDEITPLIKMRNLPAIEAALVECWANSTSDEDEEGSENPPTPATNES